MKKDLHYYKALPYTRRWQRVDDPGDGVYWHAWIEELPGCEVDGDTRPAAMANLSEAFEDYITSKLEWGSEVPEPTRWKQPILSLPVGSSTRGGAFYNYQENNPRKKPDSGGVAQPAVKVGVPHDDIVTAVA